MQPGALEKRYRTAGGKEKTDPNGVRNRNAVPVD
jgi:hypothetical protein